MTIEKEIFSLLSPLVNKRVYPDTPPDVFDTPFIVYQQISGNVVQYVDGSLPDKHNARVQFWIWGTTRQEVSALARSLQETLTGSGLVCEPYGEFTSAYDDSVKLYGARQDFGFWY